MANVVLKHEEKQEAPVPALPLPPAMATTDTAEIATTKADVAPATRRYDQAMIEQALALAVQMQQEHQATLTAEQVVRLGAEINVDQAFVLKALSQLNAEHPVVTQSEKPIQLQETSSVRFRALTATDKVATVLVPLLFSVFAFFAFRDLPPNSMLFPLFMFVAAPLLALFLGFCLRSKRLGFLSGALLGLLMMTAVWVMDVMGSDLPTDSDVPRMLIWTLVFTLAGATLGLLAAIVARHGARMYQRSAAALARLFPGLAEPDA